FLIGGFAIAHRLLEVASPVFMLLQKQVSSLLCREGWPTAHREAILGVGESLLPQQIGCKSTAGGSVPSFPSCSVARAGPLTLAQARRGVTQKNKGRGLVVAF
ncbi:unnamed protein product, partial [Ectocarpus sp. 4 AP-2014]